MRGQKGRIKWCFRSSPRRFRDSQVSYNGRTAKLIAYVSNQINQDLLGMPWIEELEIIPKELMFPNSSQITNSVPTMDQKISPVNLKNFGKFQQKHQNMERQFNDKNGAKPITFQNGEPVFIWNLKGKLVAGDDYRESWLLSGLSSRRPDARLRSQPPCQPDSPPFSSGIGDTANWPTKWK